uniref:Uncharacterized protein n=1 Tax=Anguilla anguilla TaxID=7936 RepID=A0A0E9UA77_ANGAN
MQDFSPLDFTAERSGLSGTLLSLIP